ncbi:MAG: hypothetical protein IT443_08510 [Phycisphaeraceae bacterium]|nr:hypothetical protein [Phycisphaeraceae bacterium]
MNLTTFLEHHGLTQNPFDAEEACHDPVFERLTGSTSRHPDFGKIAGRFDAPSTSVVFGEKGSGKTALRLTLVHQAGAYNTANATGRVVVVSYDEFNPLIDRLTRRRARGASLATLSEQAIMQLLQSIRLEDHQDAILSLAITQFIDALLSPRATPSPLLPLPADLSARLKKMPRAARADLAVLAALYDQPASGSIHDRFFALRSFLRLGRLRRGHWSGIFAGTLAVAGVALASIRYLFPQSVPDWNLPVSALLLAGALILGVVWSWRQAGLWWLTRRIRKELQAVDRAPGDLRRQLAELRGTDLVGQPWPLQGGQDSRYQLTSRFLGALKHLGYAGMIVLVDRVDEPVAVVGRGDRMRALIWPMLDNKFLQQIGVGVKLLLPIELRHLLFRESSEFFQEARLDKQNLVERLRWSGVTLYDLCTDRLRACLRESKAAGPEAAKGYPGIPVAIPGVAGAGYDPPLTNVRGSSMPSLPGGGNALSLTNLFEPDVSTETLIDALDQMRQPRDAFKFLYAVLMEHCRNVPEEQPRFRIPRLVLESVRRYHAQRLQDMAQGLLPA